MKPQIFALVAAGLLSVAACEQKAPETTPTITPSLTVGADDDESCDVTVTRDWAPAGATGRLMSEAGVMGPDCAKGVVTLAIRDGDGTPLYSWSGQVANVFGLNAAKDVGAMKSALLEWMDQSGAMLKTTGDLPAWETTDGQPKRAEFPFMPESWVDEAGWNDLRQHRYPMFCFPQGMESMKCALLRDAGMEDLGLQLFPG